MSNYYLFSDGSYHSEDELRHYGIPGMRWGHKKADPNKMVSVRRGIKNAKSASKKAYYDSAEKSGAKKVGPAVAHPNVKSKHKARAAGKNAYKESIKNDKAHNKQLRADRKQKKNEFRDARRDVSKSRGTGSKLVTNILAGPFANRTYNSVIAAGGSKSSAMALTAVGSILGGPTGIGHLTISAMYTHDAGKKK